MAGGCGCVGAAAGAGTVKEGVNALAVGLKLNDLALGLSLSLVAGFFNSSLISFSSFLALVSSFLSDLASVAVLSGSTFFSSEVSLTSVDSLAVSPASFSASFAAAASAPFWAFA